MGGGNIVVSLRDLVEVRGFAATSSTGGSHTIELLDCSIIMIVSCRCGSCVEGRVTASQYLPSHAGR